MRTLFLTVVLSLVACGDDDDGPKTPRPDRDWRDEIVYQLLTDRFANGDTGNDTGVDLLCNTCWHGGDWQGIIDRLDYLEALGVTALWISPVVENADSPLASDAYHGYWPRALDRANPHFGSEADLDALVSACHERDIKVIIDVVVNHLGPIAYYDINENGQLDATGAPATPGNELAPPFNAAGIQNASGTAAASFVFFEQSTISPESFANADWYHRMGQITDFNNPTQALNGDFAGGLRDLDTTRTDVRAALSSVTSEWLRRLPIDGMRLDAAKHVETELWQSLLPELRTVFAAERSDPDDGLMLVAEVFDGNINSLSDFTEPPLFDSVLNFAAKFQVFDEVFKRGNATTLIDRHHRDKESGFASAPHEGGLKTAPNRVLFNFVDNHDVPRFLSEQPDPAALRTALAYLMTMDGVPVIYYGTEQELAGGVDPLNREDLWASNYDQNNSTFVWLSRLAQLRRELEPLRRGDTNFVFTTDHTGAEVDAGMVAFERFTASERVLVVINASEHESQTTSSGDPMQVSFAPGTSLTDRLGTLSATLEVASDGTLAVTLPARGAAVLIP